jgi:molecular chaperone GrpE
VDNPAVPSSTVVQVFQDGYTIHDRLLRPAMVVVSRGGPKRAPGGAGKQDPAGGVNTTA